MVHNFVLLLAHIRGHTQVKERDKMEEKYYVG